MEFNVATVQASGLKELLILKLKKQASFRKFKALDQVSFDIQKGEVVGIIGTNGSGKSTILKIISGALMPTSGRVKVDKRKVQLLTLGTGFDMELTARENIYLNGAIIGYSREYIDKHFDEIIQFAELEEFVDEKLKNYSSGMVSRLGFAIATSGDAAEILILDEVLSVGDIYFKEKSMKRIQEMIHGGSTVIMVSHSVDTIRKNCTRAIWIEKGKLLADGEPKDVCKMYADMQKKRKKDL
ncbi:MAG: ABC transporter ATP-binding protein [Lachnospiraceae bacterium]|nr:ABC transporter ATP-binding protein [Lachnospiraceae bacterium]